jgi:hypothetical protein
MDFLHHLYRALRIATCLSVVSHSTLLYRRLKY